MNFILTSFEVKKITCFNDVLIIKMFFHLTQYKSVSYYFKIMKKLVDKSIINITIST